MVLSCMASTDFSLQIYCNDEASDRQIASLVRERTAKLHKGYNELLRQGRAINLNTASPDRDVVRYIPPMAPEGTMGFLKQFPE